MKLKTVASVALAGAVAFGIGTNLDSFAGFTKTLTGNPDTLKKISTNPFIIEDFAGILSQSFEVKDFSPGQQIVHLFTPINKSGLHVKYDIKVKGTGDLFTNRGGGVPLEMKIEKKGADNKWGEVATGKANELNVYDDIPNGTPTYDNGVQPQVYRVVINWPDNGEYDNNYKNVTGAITIEVTAKQNLGAEKVFYTDMNVNGFYHKGLDIPQGTQLLQQKVTFMKDSAGANTAKVHLVGGSVDKVYTLTNKDIQVPTDTSENIRLILFYPADGKDAGDVYIKPTKEMLDFLNSSK